MAIKVCSVKNRIVTVACSPALAEKIGAISPERAERSDTPCIVVRSTDGRLLMWPLDPRLLLNKKKR